MQNLYCWRCREIVPMLDETEFQLVNKLYGECIQSVKNDRIEHNRTLAEVDVWQHFKPMRKAYSDLTGSPELHQDAIMYHRLSLYGPPCKLCAKPLRTPMAKLCAACGQLRESKLGSNSALSKPNAHYYRVSPSPKLGRG